MNDYARGPSQHFRRPGPVVEVYADTGAIDRDCTDCGAETGSFCVWPDTGIERKTPCRARQTGDA